MAGEQQWLRYFRLYVQRDSGSQEMLDLSDYRVKFHITQNSTGRPCTAEISVYHGEQDQLPDVHADRPEQAALPRDH